MSQPLLRIRPPAGRLAVLGGIAAVIFGAWMGLWLAGCWEVTKPSACLPGTPLPDLTLPRLWTLPRAGEPPSGYGRPAEIAAAEALARVRLRSFQGHKVLCLFMSSFT